MNLLANVALALLLLQTRRVTPRQPGSSGISGSNAEAVATFAGTFKSADKKFLTIEVEDGQTMRMYITGSTRFVRGGKPAKAAEFHNGESVTVDAERDARMNLLAVRVETAKATAGHPLD